MEGSIKNLNGVVQGRKEDVFKVWQVQRSSLRREEILGGKGEAIIM
jgi:hypothetical protein